MVKQDKDDKKLDIAIIKKYANRRLYNTQTSCYITIADVSEMIKRGEDFIVLDARTNDDLTRSILTQVIIEKESKGVNLLPISFLRQLANLYDKNLDEMGEVFPKYLEVSIEMFLKNQEKIGSIVGEFSPIKIFENIAQQNIDFINRTMNIFDHTNKNKDKK